MIAIQFDKTRAEHFIDCLKNGKDIKCKPEGWTQVDMLGLAGALFAAAISQGAPLHQDIEELMSRPFEHREMIEEEFTADLRGAIEFYSMLTFKVMDHEFDAQFEPSVTALVEGSTGDVAPLRGFREFPDADPTA
jgi:hypothetical protein